MVGTKGRSGGDHVTSGTDPFPEDGLPEAPGDLSSEERAVWDALLDQLPEQLLRGVDCYMLGCLARCVCDARKCHELWREGSDPKYLRLVRTTESQLNKLSALFGLTPSDRTRLKFTPPVEDDAAEWESS